MDCKPLCIRDPRADSTIKLRPNQDLWLSIQDGAVPAEYDSCFFTLSDECDEQDGVRTYMFTQKFDLTDWTDISSVYLGEISVFRPCSPSYTLSVFLDSPKSQVVTVINPSNCMLKLRPAQILEVVIFGGKKGPFDWETKIDPGSFGICYSQINHVSINPKEFVFNPQVFRNEICVPYPRISDVTCEHHFWFRLNTMDMRVVWPTGVYHGGAISIGDKNGKCHYTVHLDVRVKTKDRKKTIVKPIVSKYTNWFSPMTEDVLLQRREIISLFEGCRVFVTDVTKRSRNATPK